MTALAHRPRVRARRDGGLDIVGVTNLVSTPHGRHHLVAWRVHPGPLRETPEPAVSAAAKRFHNTPDGLVLLDGEWLVEQDVIGLLSATRKALKSGDFRCFLCLSAPTYRADVASCLTCYRKECD